MCVCVFLCMYVSSVELELLSITGGHRDSRVSGAIKRVRKVSLIN